MTSSSMHAKQHATKRSHSASSVKGSSVMPLYFFHLSFGDRSLPDDEGVELPNRSAAREEALAAVRDLSDPAVGGNPRRWASWFLQVAGERLLRSPITGNARCCAPAVNGHAAAPPSSVMNSRRLTRSPRRRGRAAWRESRI